MAKGFLSRGARIVAAGVVLHHSSPKCQMGSGSHLSLGPPTTTDVMIQQGLNWGPAKDMPILKSRIRDLFEGDFSLVMVMQVMLVRRVQPCKRRPLRMWEFNPEGPCTIQNFLDMTHEEMYKSFFGPQIECSDTTEAPLPEGLDNPVLEKMLEPAPRLVPSKEDEGGIKREKAGLHRYLFQSKE